MKPEAQRIAIAEARGLVAPFTTDKEWEEDGDSDGFREVLRDSNGRRVSDYLSDLNAMHEAEKGLTEEQRLGYISWLAVLSENPWCAPAPQRAEAFLRTIGKWTVEPQ